MKKYVLFGLTGIALLVTSLIIIKPSTTLTANQAATNFPMPTVVPTSRPLPSPIIILKDVGEPQYEHFGLTEQDFKTIAEAHFTHITENFDLCAEPADVKWYLDMAAKYDLQVILQAGAGEAEWGYACDQESYPLVQKPVWQKELVKKWINQWKNHPAVFAWDISNEAGLNFPNGENNPEIGENWGHNAITLNQLRQAAADVQEIDPGHPRMIRMSGYVFYENTTYFFEQKNPFEADLAEIVMINVYSNTEDYDPKLVTDITTKAEKAINHIDPATLTIYSLGVWNEPPMWVKPSLEQVQNDYTQLAQFRDIAYYRYGAQAGSDWYFPDPDRGDPTLWDHISASNRRLQSK